VQLDPLGPILGLLFEDGSSDHILGVLSKSGIPSHFDLTPEEAYSHNTRKRAYRRRLVPILGAFDDPTRHKIAENLASEMARKDGAMAQRLGDVLAGVGWYIDNKRLIPLGGKTAAAVSAGVEFNLTEEQWDLIRTIVKVYNTGCRSEFLVIQTMDSKPTLLYLTGCHPNVEVEAGASDFERLCAEGLIDLGRNSGGDLRGKPTALGIKAIAGNRRPPVAIVDRRLIYQDRQSATGKSIFIGHGHSHEWRVLKDFIGDRLKLDWDEFNREPVAGKTTQQRLREMLNKATFAFIVMTAEDEQPDGSRRARENVIHETGLFQGRLGFERAIILLEEGCAEFSNIHGLTTIRFPHGNLGAAFEDVRRVLEREGILNS
jgi:hypothetical protein